MRPFREDRLRMIQQYVGRHYGDAKGKQRVPVNMLEMAINIYVRALAAKSPQVIAKTRFSALAQEANSIETGINQTLKEMDFESEMRRVVKDSLFMLGVMKVGVAPVDEMLGYEHDGGQLYADSIDLDDWVQDMNASRWDQIHFCGHRYRVDFETLKNSKLASKKVLDKLVPSEYEYLTDEGVPRASTVGVDPRHQDEAVYDEITLWDIWLPRDNLLLTIPSDNSHGLKIEDIVQEVEWSGPEHGPYRRLEFEEVPGNSMPISPAAIWLDLHELANSVFRKLADQAERQKRIGIVGQGSEEDGELIRDVKDGQIISVANPGATREASLGGIDNNNMAFFLQTHDLFNRFAGNLDLLGGISPASGTATQDTMLNANASRRLQAMQARVLTFTKKVVTDLGQYMFEDPELNMALQLSDPNDVVTVTEQWTAEQIEGNFWQYNIDIVPFSMQDKSPQETLAFINQIITSIAIPLLPHLEKNGITIDFEELFKLYAKYGNTPELIDVLTFQSGETEPEQPSGGERPTQSPVTTRTNVRVNRPEGTRSSRDNALAQTLVASGSNNQAGLAAVRGQG